MVKGGSRVLGKGGGQNIELTVHVMVPSTGLCPVDETPLALPRGGLEGVTPSTIRKKRNKEDFRYNLITHRNQIY